MPGPGPLPIPSRLSRVTPTFEMDGLLSLAEGGGSASALPCHADVAGKTGAVLPPRLCLASGMAWQGEADAQAELKAGPWASSWLRAGRDKRGAGEA